MGGPTVADNLRHSEFPFDNAGYVGGHVLVKVFLWRPITICFVLGWMFGGWGWLELCLGDGWTKGCKHIPIYPLNIFVCGFICFGKCIFIVFPFCV